MTVSAWTLGWRSLWRDLRSGELRLLMVAVMLAVAALTAVGFFADRLGNGLLEVPVTTLRVLSRNLPSSGGGYFRLLPYALSRWMIGRVNRQDREAAVFYFHPWELDTGQPRIPGIGTKTRFRHYVNIPRMEGRLQSLLSDFRWGRMDQIFLGRAVAPA